MSPSSPDPESLLEHGPWLRGLARSLVGDDATADDLVQETWVAALKSPPRESSRAWLSRVVHNFARKRHRSESRRRRRETEVARGRADTDEASADWVEQMELHRRVVDAVLALPEPYREMVVRRYFHEATPTEIAERLDLPVKTVKTRLHRALERLRRELDERYGSRAAWAVVALPLAKSAVPTALATSATAGSVSILEWLGGLGMAGSKLGVAGAVIVLIAAVVWWWPDSTTVGPAETSPVAGGTEEESARPSDPPASGAGSIASDGESTPSTRVVRGVAVDRDTGAPIVGARVDWVLDYRPKSDGWYLRKGNDHRQATRPEEAKLDGLALSLPFDPRRETTAPGDGAVTDEAGEFELAPPPEGALFFRVAHEDYRYGWRSAEEATADSRVELARKRWLSIDVRDAEGRVPDVPSALVHGYVYGKLDVAPEWEIYGAFHWDDNGVARIELPDTHRVSVSLSAPKFGWQTTAVESVGGELSLDLDLEPHPFVGARVVDPAGDPVPGVQAVVFHESADHPTREGAVVRCGDDGRFVANVRDTGPVFVAFSADGFAGREVSDLERGRDDQVVVLEKVTLASVTGVVVTSDARPRAGWTVELTNATLSGPPLSSVTDEAGRFGLAEVPLGRYDAIVWSVTEDGIRSRLVGLEGTPFVVGERRAAVELTVAPDTGRIVGSVETPEHGPATDTMIFLHRVGLLGSSETVSLTGVVDAGWYAVEAVPTGRYLVTVGLGRSTSQVVRVEAGDTAEARFGHDSRRVQLEVTRRGEPTVGAKTLAGLFDTSGAIPLLSDVRASETNADGRSGKGLYRAGRYLLRVEHERAAFVELFDVERESGSESDGAHPLVLPIAWPEGQLHLEAEGAGSFTVDLLEIEGIAVETTVPLAQRRIGYGEATPDRTADGHRFTIDGVRAARYRLAFTSSDGTTRARTVDVPPSGLRLRVDALWIAE